MISHTANGTVGTPDLLIVINSWGSCQDGVICLADLTRPLPGVPPDGIVGTADLLAVITAWGPCETLMMGGSEPPLWLEEITAILYDYELTEEEQIELIQQILSEQCEEN